MRKPPGMQVHFVRCRDSDAIPSCVRAPLPRTLLPLALYTSSRSYIGGNREKEKSRSPAVAVRRVYAAEVSLRGRWVNWIEQCERAPASGVCLCPTNHRAAAV